MGAIREGFVIDGFDSTARTPYSKPPDSAVRNLPGPPLVVGVNALPLRRDGGGARFVFTGLMQAMLAVEDRLSYVIFVDDESAPLVIEIIGASVLSGGGPNPGRVRLARVSNHESVQAHAHEFDLYFCPLNNIQPRLVDRPTVAILHDIQEQYFPQYFSRPDLLGRAEDYPDLCHSSTFVVTVSEFSRGTIIEKFRIDPRKVKVVYNAPQPMQRTSVTWTGEGGYLLYPANTYRHKNHELLLSALSRLRKDHGIRIRCIFLGHEIPGGFPLVRAIAELGLGDDCSTRTGLRAEEVADLYAGAAAVVMPTMFEGFGMPAIEAQLCGAPLICSDLPSLREVTGGHAVFFEPGNVDALVEILSRFHRGELQDVVRDLMPRASENARRFSWEKSARSMVEILSAAQREFRGDEVPGPAAPLPRIAVVITGHGPDALATLESIRSSEYPNWALAMSGESSEEEKGILAQMGVASIPHTQDERRAWTLADFAASERADMVLELRAGTRMARSAPWSLRWAFNADPGRAAWIGETIGLGHPRTRSRLRRTGDGYWRMEGGLQPEMLAFSPATLRKMIEDNEIVASPEWRHAVVLRLQTNDRLFNMRRLIGEVNLSDKSLLKRLNEYRLAHNRYYRVVDGTVRYAPLLRALEPVLKRLSRALPFGIRQSLRRAWNHLVTDR